MSALNDRSRRLEARFLEKREKLSQLKAISEGNNIKNKEEKYLKKRKRIEGYYVYMAFWHF